eukprot:1245078-Pyramimonas_sp.AAC.1
MMKTKAAETGLLARFAHAQLLKRNLPHRAQDALLVGKNLMLFRDALREIHDPFDIPASAMQKLMDCVRSTRRVPCNDH